MNEDQRLIAALMAHVDDVNNGFALAAQRGLRVECQVVVRSPRGYSAVSLSVEILKLIEPDSPE